MVSARSKNPKAKPTSEVFKMWSPSSDGDTIHVRMPAKQTASVASAAPMLPYLAMHSRAISEHDLGLTSPLTSEGSRESNMNTPGHDDRDIARANAQLLPPLPQLAQAPASPVGDALNPIIVTDSSPSQQNHTMNSERQNQPTPHLFLGRGYSQLYAARPAGQVLAPKPANGSTFTGHLSHDYYRTMYAKYLPRPNVNVEDFSRVPFEVQYPGLAQHAARPATNVSVEDYVKVPKVSGDYVKVPFNVAYPAAAAFLKSRAGVKYGDLPFHRSVEQHRRLMEQYHSSLPALPFPVPNHTVPYPEFEDRLRGKAIHYIHEFHRLNPRKRRLSELDPDETSGSDSMQQVPVLKTSPAKKVPLHQDESDLELAKLTDQSELLSSLLNVYPVSKDQKGLRDDIGMLVAVQTQRVAAWMKTEKNLARKRQRVNGERQTEQIHTQVSTTPKEEMQMQAGKRDGEMRGFLSAEGALWQDGSGLGVADVFGMEARVAEGESGGVLDSNDGDDERVDAQDGRHVVSDTVRTLSFV